MAKQFINIDFPFKDSPLGFLLNMNETDDRAVKADLMHLLLTNKGERLYLPDFGTDLRKHLFNQNDTITHEKIKEDINDAIKKYIPNLKVNNILIETPETNEYQAIVRLDYTITEDVYETKDYVIIQL